MKKISIIILVILTVFGCEKDLSPIVTDFSVYYTGKNDQGLYEFRIVNDLQESYWYWAHTEKVPIYQYSILNVKGWEDGGPGWCGTGLMLFELKPDESFILAIPQPGDNRPWRAGIRIYQSKEDEGEMIWSQKIDR